MLRSFCLFMAEFGNCSFTYWMALLYWVLSWVNISWNKNHSKTPFEQEKNVMSSVFFRFFFFIPLVKYGLGDGNPDNEQNPWSVGLLLRPKCLSITEYSFSCWFTSRESGEIKANYFKGQYLPHKVTLRDMILGCLDAISILVLCIF